MTTTSAPVGDQAATKRFLREKRLALVGASDDPKSFARCASPSQRLDDRGASLGTWNSIKTACKS